MNAHTLGITHPAVGGFRFRKLTVYGLLSGEDPRVAAGDVGTENLPREGVEHHGGRVAALTVEKVDGAASLGADHPFVHALLAAGFHQTPKGVRLRR